MAYTKDELAAACTLTEILRDPTLTDEGIADALDTPVESDSDDGKFRRLLSGEGEEELVGFRGFLEGTRKLSIGVGRMLSTRSSEIDRGPSISSKLQMMNSSKTERILVRSTPQWTKSRDDALDLLLPIEKRYLHKVHWLTDDRHVKEAFLDWKPVQLFLKTQAVDSPRGVFTPKTFDPLTASALILPENEEQTPGLLPQPTKCCEPTPLFELKGKKLKAINNRRQTKTRKLADGTEEDIAGAFLFPENERLEDLESKKGKKVAKSRRIVFMDMKLKRMSDIDTNSLTFRCKFHFYLTWMATYSEVESWFLWLYSKKKKKEDVSKWEPKWKPSLSFVNGVEKHHFYNDGFKVKSGWNKSFSPPKGDKTKPDDLMYPGYSWDISKDDLGCDPREAYWIRVRYHVEYTFSEELELNAFPFDCQNFSIFIKMDSDKTTEADLVPFPRLGEYLMLDSQFSVLSEWSLHNVVCEWKNTDPNESKAHWTYPLVAIHIKAARKWKARMSFILTTLCMQTLGLCAFSISKEESIGERMSYCVMLLLADVTLLQLMFNQLPTISYVTILDQIMWFCFGFLFLVTVWSAIEGDFPHIQHVQKSDGKAFGVFFVLYVCSIVYFTFMSIFVRRMEMKKHAMTEEQLHELEKEREVWWIYNWHQNPRCVVKLPWDRQMIYGKDNCKQKQMVSFQKQQDI